MATQDEKRGRRPPDLERGARLRELRRGRGWTQAQVAEKIGVSPPAVRSWENKGVAPSTPHLHRLAILYEVPVSELDPGVADFPGEAELAQDFADDRDAFVYRRLVSITERLDELRDVPDRLTALVGEVVRLRELQEEQAAALLPLVTALLSSAADRRGSEAEPTSREERRVSGGRRQMDPRRPQGA